MLRVRVTDAEHPYLASEDITAGVVFAAVQRNHPVFRSA